MGQTFHESATTTHAIRAAIQQSKAPLQAFERAARPQSEDGHAPSRTLRFDGSIATPTRACERTWPHSSGRTLRQALEEFTWPHRPMSGSVSAGQSSLEDSD